MDGKWVSGFFLEVLNIFVVTVLHFLLQWEGIQIETEGYTQSPVKVLNFYAKKIILALRKYRFMLNLYRILHFIEDLGIFFQRFENEYVLDKRKRI